MNIIKKNGGLFPDCVKTEAAKFIRWRYRRSIGLKLINTDYQIISIGRKGVDTYFGYYDISPFNSKDQLIYLEKKRKKLKANIILNSVSADNPRIIAETHAVNMQQGSRLRWYPGNDDSVMFNDYVDDKYLCRIIDINTKEERHLQYPVYDVSFDGRFYATLDFERLGALRPGYGYTNRQYHTPDNLSEEGVRIYDVASGELIADITYRMISKAMGHENVDFSKFYLNHLSFSPDGTKILFFWIEKIGNWDQANLLTYNLITKNLYIHEREYKVSHYTWLDNETILCTAIKGNSIDNMQCRYYLYKEGAARQVVGGDTLTQDGHPTYVNSNVILSDTYPFDHGMQELFLFDTKTGIKRRLVYSNSVRVESTECRTDMHPRLNNDKSIICYDANVSGDRKLYLLKNWE